MLIIADIEYKPKHILKRVYHSGEKAIQRWVSYVLFHLITTYFPKPKLRLIFTSYRSLNEETDESNDYSSTSPIGTDNDESDNSPIKSNTDHTSYYQSLENTAQGNNDRISSTHKISINLGTSHSERNSLKSTVFGGNHFSYKQRVNESVWVNHLR
jgi:hypothetical protein